MMVPDKYHFDTHPYSCKIVVARSNFLVGSEPFSVESQIPYSCRPRHSPHLLKCFAPTKYKFLKSLPPHPLLHKLVCAYEHKLKQRKRESGGWNFVKRKKNKKHCLDTTLRHRQA